MMVVDHVKPNLDLYFPKSNSFLCIAGTTEDTPKAMLTSARRSDSLQMAMAS